ncbi:hypothetical protein NMG29_22580 [Streptomyces cocklensis]|jgi:hypothetical protein|uniref:Flagellar hook-length control protein fliK n=1 Tax=Actinacidiphila cocklensis TaxID=887465 RepID=A0A9W4DKV6_9ACTN|nr:hypothetical protein [Actinacidiphila cocklensis]MDD1060969.1 hypothetical protein [Actinacidiphila cocklensis]WSX77295.1 hypothetical protein OH826_27690 [Streptomyces sp. NBC_00899]CAG6391533.1 Flagellar hook-length control protein fliK [Actinacidiphila cocklensis]
MSAHDHQDPQPAPTFSDLLAAAEAALRISTPPPATPPQSAAPRPATPRPPVPDKDAA